MIGFSFCARVVMAVVVEGQCRELTFRRSRRLIRTRGNKSSFSLPTIWPVSWLQRVAPIMGCQSAHVGVVGLCLQSLIYL